MFATQVACPQCRAVLKLAQPVAVGYPLQCPVCGVSFAVSPEGIRAAGTALGPDGYAVSSPRVDTRADVPRVRTRLEAPRYENPLAPAPYLPYAQAPPPAGNRALLLSLIIGGVLLFVGTAIGLAILCFSGSSEPRPADGARVNKDADPVRDIPADKGKEVVAEKPKPKPAEPPPLAPEDQARVDQAVKAGVDYLKRTQRDDGTWDVPLGRLQWFRTGYNALAGLTLLECGVPADDPKMQKTAEALRKAFPEDVATTDLFAGDTDAWKYQDRTYDVALTVLFLDRLKQPQDKGLIQRLALRLVAGQTASGGWHYLCPKLSPGDHQKLLSVLRDNNTLGGTRDLKLPRLDPDKLRIGGTEALPDPMKRLAVWQDQPADKDAGRLADNSNTQFAILALWAARNHDAPVQRSLALLAQRFRKSQNDLTGAWTYSSQTAQLHGVVHPTMTCAGLLGLAVGLGLENEVKDNGRPLAAPKKPHEDPQVKKGLNVVANSLTDPAKPWRQGTPLVDLYFVWSVERVAVIYNLDKLNGKDWYGWGAEMLVANQKPDGTWQHNNYASNPTKESNPSALVDTCFGLLFLKRANLAKDLTSKLLLTE